MRLRTLPLSLSGIILGIFLASDTFSIKPLSVVFLILTAVFLQILSNLSNELGDAINGLDTKARKGVHYSIQDGEMTVDQMRTLIAVIILACCASGLVMIWSCFGNLMRPEALLFVALGACAIAAAMRYTLGRNPYGYRAKGDIYVFLFFGLVSVMGAYFVCTQGLGLHWKLLLPAAGVGFFSVGVLNVNNTRDAKTDAVNRVTVAIKLGPKKARIYQTVLIGLGWACMTAYCLLCWPSWWHWVWVITLPLYIKHLKGIWTLEDEKLDPMLPLLVISTFALCLLMGLGFCAYLF